MALDISKLKSRLSSLTNQGNKTNLIWKPKPGKQVVRIVPYKYQNDNPFIELKFHYNINNKTYLSPDSFNRPDPIVEWSNRMKKTGNKEDWLLGRKFEPKMRTYAPILVRGEENEGVRFWGFGKNVYQEILSIISDVDYGDITDLVNGRDIVVEFRTAEDSGKSFPETTIRVKPNASVAIDVAQKEIELKQHARDLRQHVKTLSDKKYWDKFGHASPDFVVMFIPGEGFVSDAMRADSSLMEDAMKANVIIASPVNLLSLLLTVSKSWQSHQLAEHAEAVAKLGVEVYERIGTVIDEMNKMGKNLGTANTAFNTMALSFESRLLVTLRRF